MAFLGFASACDNRFAPRSPLLEVPSGSRHEMIDAMTPDSNPLLDFSGLPRFADIKVEHIAPAIDALLSENRATLARLAKTDTPATWESIVQPLEDSGERLTRAWAQIGHLNAVVDTPELREAYNASLPKL